MTGERAGGYVLLGKIVKPHGIRGELKVYPYTEQPGNILVYKELLLSPADSFDPEIRELIRGRVQGKYVIMCLDQCPDRNTAELLAGMEIYIERSALPELDEDEYYLRELLGKTAVFNGTPFGAICNIVSGSGHDLLLVVSDDGKDILIPLIDEFIVEHDGDRVIFDLPPGLLELYM